ncbi:MAG: hypothetical protein E7461_04110 [Ruminococcaceae bacterium]|nr:hypothetical protein [Oscillospiraceae bacterium]
MKTWKKLLAALLTVAMICVLAACVQPETPAGNTATVTFMNGSEVYETATVEIGGTLTLPKAPRGEKGKGLVGWTTIDGDVEEVIDPETFVVEADITLYALWADVYTVVINADNGTAFDVKEVFAGTVLEKPADPVKEGFKFVEWRDAIAETTFDWTQPIQGDVTIKAMYGDGAPNRVSDTKWDFTLGHGSWIGGQGGWNRVDNGINATDMVYTTTEDGYAAWGFTKVDSLENLPVINGENAEGYGMKFLYNEGISVEASKAKLVVAYMKPKYFPMDNFADNEDQFRISILTSNGGMIYGYGTGSDVWSLRTDGGSKNLIQVDQMEDGWIRVQFKIHELDVWSEDAILKSMSISFVQRKSTPVMDIISFKSIELLDQEEFIDPHQIDYVTNNKWDMTKEEESKDWFGVLNKGVDTNNLKTTIDENGTRYVYTSTNKWRGMVMNPAKIDISKCSGIFAVTMDITGMSPTNYRLYIETDKGGDSYDKDKDDASCYYAETSTTDLAGGWTVTPNVDGTITVYYDLTKLEYWKTGTELNGLSFVLVDGTSNGAVVYKSVSLVDSVKTHNCETDGHMWKDATCEAPKTCAACGVTEGEVADHSYVDGVCSICGIAQVIRNEWDLSDETAAADWAAYHAMSKEHASNPVSSEVTENGLLVTFGGDGNAWKGIVLEKTALEISKLTGKLTFTYSTDLSLAAYRVYIVTDKGGDPVNNNTDVDKINYYSAPKIADIDAGTATGWTRVINQDGSVTVTFDLKTLPFFAEGTELKSLTICTIGAVKETGTATYISVELEKVPEGYNCETEGHIMNPANCTEPATCSVCGATEGEANGHSWKDATCTAAKTCSVCGATEGEAAGHSWVAATCTKSKNCSVCGTKEGEALGHTFVNGVCSVCGHIEGEPDPIVWDLSNKADAADWGAYLSKKKNEQLTTEVTSDGLQVNFAHENNWRAIILEEAAIDISKLTGKLTFTYSTDLTMTNYRIHLATDLGGTLTANGTAGVNYVDVKIANILAGSVTGWTQTTNADGSYTVTVDLKTFSDFVNGTELKGLTICTVSEKKANTTITYKSVEIQ